MKAEQTLRILQVNTSDQGGGAEGSAWNLFRTYRARGYKSWLAVGLKRSDDADVYRIPLNKTNGFFHRMSEVVRGPLERYYGKLRGAGRLRTILPLATSFEKLHNWRNGIENCFGYGSDGLLTLTPEQPDIVHCHNLHGGYFDLESLALLSQKVPVILNLRDCWLLTGHCAHPINCNKWLSGCGGCPDLFLPPKIRRDSTNFNWKRKKDILKRSRVCIVANSQWMLEQAGKSGLTGTDCCVIENGIDLSVFKPRDKAKAREITGLPATAKIIMLAADNARRNPWKDYKTIEDTMMYLAESYKGEELIFVCVGGCDKTRKISDNITIKFIGFVKEAGLMAAYYCSANIYVHAAKAESSCKAVTEAMACGVPVVATAVGGIPEQIEDGINGFLTRPGEPKEMALRIRMILENDDLRARMSKEAVRSSQRFDLNRQADEFLVLYECLMKKQQEVTCNV